MQIITGRGHFYNFFDIYVMELYFHSLCLVNKILPFHRGFGELWLGEMEVRSLLRSNLIFEMLISFVSVSARVARGAKGNILCLASHKGRGIH